MRRSASQRPWAGRGLACHLSMDDTRANDISGNQNNGVLSGSPAPVPGSVERYRGWKFDGSNSYIDLGSSSSLNPMAITIMVWVYFSSLANAYTAVVSRLNGNTSGLYQLFVKSNGTLAWYVNGSFLAFYDGTGANTLVTGRWYHLAVAYDAAGGTGYVNAVVDGTIGAAGALGTVAANANVGRDSGTAGRILNGYIRSGRHGLKIFNRAVGRDEIYAHYAAGLRADEEDELPFLYAPAASAGRSILVNNPYAGRSILVNNESLAA